MNWENVSHQLSRFSLALLTCLSGLSASRLLYELLFPRWTWLGRPLVILPLALLAAAASWWFWSRPDFANREWHCSSLFWPIALNLIYLFDPEIDLVRGRLVFLASIWLTALLLADKISGPGTWSRRGGFLVIAALLPTYLITMPHTVGRADTFEFQVVAPQLGIAHPTGYPLYLLLGKLFTLIPLGTVAWRLNLSSAVYALLAASLLYLTARRLSTNRLAAVLGAVVLGLTPTFWSQAIEAEVYALHSLFTSLALLLLAVVDDEQEWAEQQRGFTFLALVIGLSLSNHLTSLFLLPPTALMLLFKYRASRPPLAHLARWLAKLALLFLLPLSLYVYLPLRWAAVNGEAMGLSRFVDWVIGGRFQGALQWGAWLNDFTRYKIVGRLYLDNWGGLNLLVASGGFIYLFYRRRRMALVMFVTWLGYTFYALNYHVPDLAVFLLPSQLIIAICWAAGLAWGLSFIASGLQRQIIPRRSSSWHAATRRLLVLARAAPTVLAAARLWSQLDRSKEDGLTTWGKGVLNLPLADQAAILADSEKIAPLYYLQQAEGMRPDLDIMVLPDEATYRAELDARLADGQEVYLARYLPGLEGVYHLRAMGPLTEVSSRPLTTLPADVIPSEVSASGIRLLGYRLEPEAAVATDHSAITLFWQADRSIHEILYVYVRWQPASGLVGTPAAAGQHPANNYYPTVAWRPKEIVPDFHLLAWPGNSALTTLILEVALAPPFAPADQIAWQQVASVDLPQGRFRQAKEQPLRVQMDGLLLSGSDLPAQVRPQTELPVRISGFGEVDALQLRLRRAGSLQRRWFGERPTPPVLPTPFTDAVQLSAGVANGQYQIVASQGQSAALCSWWFYAQSGCVIGEVLVSGVPLPQGATNFEDKIALLSYQVAETTLQPGGQLHVDLTWQGLAPLDEDYTVFLQVLDAQDRLVGQIDAWPQQGTYPTSQWTAGETIVDSYVIQLDDPLPPGTYRLQIGWYLLGTLRRLPILDDQGLPADDKIVIPGLVVP